MQQNSKEKGYSLKLVGLCAGQISQAMEAVVIAKLTYYTRMQKDLPTAKTRVYTRA